MELGFKREERMVTPAGIPPGAPFPPPSPKSPRLVLCNLTAPTTSGLSSASSHLPSPWLAWWLPTAPYPPLSDSYLLTPACPSLSYFRFIWLRQWTLGSLTPAPPHLLPLRAHTQ